MEEAACHSGDIPLQSPRHGNPAQQLLYDFWAPKREAPEHLGHRSLNRQGMGT